MLAGTTTCTLALAKLVALTRYDDDGRMIETREESLEELSTDKDDYIFITFANLPRVIFLSVVSLCFYLQIPFSRWQRRRRLAACQGLF